MASQEETIKAVIAALEVFSRAPDKASLERANTWLQDFQHSAEAWTVCNTILLSPDMPDASRTFAAQTFRAKVTYDLAQVAPAHRPALRDTLLAALQRYATTGPRIIIIQLCLALSGLALQMADWVETAVPGMIESLGRNPATVSTLLHFLTVLPEEVTGNTRIPMSNDDYRERSAQLLTANVSQVLELLSMYIQATGVTSAVQSQIFACIRSWLVAGEVTAAAMAETPLLEFAFQALASEPLFDSAVDVICDLIHETQEIDDNMPVIQLIVPRLIALRPNITAAKEDPDKVRGFCRIFTEAGETYRTLLLVHPETFFPIVEVIVECAAYPDLDIVPITFPFWYRLAQVIGKKTSIDPLFTDAYSSLVGIMIRHLHFPADPSTMTPQEADDFRAFRHVMGDTLKDCCYVLGPEKCLQTSFDLITAAVARGSTGATSWQEIEAPLFSIRSMGAEVDATSDTGVIPQIMDLIPSLPNHPRVRYSAILVISRYTEWIDKHPQYIPFQLTYVSSGFEDTDPEVSAAAGQAMKYLCKDCKSHLVPYLPQLHTFLTSVGPKLCQDDKLQVYEAVAHVMSSMPMDQAAQWLRTFSLSILAEVHTVASKPTPATKEELQSVADGLEQLEAMLYVIKTFGDELPAACQNTVADAWGAIDALILKYGKDSLITERAARALRHGLQFFGASALPFIPALLARMSSAFVASGHASYVWIVGKAISRFGNEEDLALRNAFQEAYEHVTAKVVTILADQPITDIPDVIEDYVRLLQSLVEYTPDLLFLSRAFPTAFTTLLASLQLVNPDILYVALDVIRVIISHDCLEPPSRSRPPPPKFPLYASAIREVVEKDGFQLVGYLLTGLVGHFPEDTSSNVVTIFRVMAAIWGSELQVWLPPVLEQLPSASVPVEAKQQFLSDVNTALANRALDKVRYAVLAFNRASRKARDRRARPIDR